MFQGKPVLAALLVLILLSFLGTLAISARTFPKSYDWRYRVISNLISPRDNPNHHWLAGCGVALTGLLMVPFTGYLRKNLENVSRWAARMSGGAFLIGIIAMICASLVVPPPMRGVSRFHDLLASAAAGFISIGMVSSCWCAWRGRRRTFSPQLFWIWSVVTLVPWAGILCSKALLLLTRLKLSWIPIESALRGSVFLQLGFWEWTGAAAVYVFLGATVLFTSSPTISITRSIDE